MNIRVTDALMTDVPVFFLREVHPGGSIGRHPLPVLLFREIVLF